MAELPATGGAARPGKQLRPAASPPPGVGKATLKQPQGGGQICVITPGQFWVVTTTARVLEEPNEEQAAISKVFGYQIRKGVYRVLQNKTLGL